MRILFVCTDADIGGAERFLATLGAEARQSDTVALAVLMGPGEMATSYAASFDEVTYLNFSASSRNIFGMVRAFNRVIGSFQPDVISSHLFHADLVTALARGHIPKTTTVHTQGFGPADHPLTRLIARAIGVLSPRFSAVIPASESPAMASFISRLRMRNVVAPIPNGAALPPQIDYDPASRTLLSLARNHPVKGHTELFTAFAQVADHAPEWDLHAYGTDVTPNNQEMREALKRANAEELVQSGRISLLGPTNSPEAALNSAAALVISSTYGEAFPIIGAEAAGAGVPVITTNVGSCSEFADDSRFLVEPGDTEALATAMKAFIALSEAERATLSRTARTRAERSYSPARVYNQYREAFEHAVNRKALRG